MKLKINNSDIVANAAALTSLTVASLTSGDIKFLNGTVFVWYKNATTGTHRPDDIGGATMGYWVESNKSTSDVLSFVDDGYDFAGNSATDLTAEAYAMDCSIMMCSALRKDYIYSQRRINDAFLAKTGVDPSAKWINCSISEKNNVIYYNQYKGLPGGAEDTDKATHLITTGQAADANAAADWLRKNHSASVSRARPAVKGRVEDARLTESIIKYLNPTDTQQLLSTISGLLNNYRDYVLVGTIIPGNVTGIHDYVNSTGTYVGNGLIEGGWTPQIGTLSDLRDRINDILFGDNTMVI